MKEQLLHLIKQSANDPKSYNALEKIYSLYEQLQYSSDLQEMGEFIYNWLNREYFIDNVNVSLFDMDKNTKESIYSKGEIFYLDDDNSFFFIINTHTDVNAIISFHVNSKTSKAIINDEYENIQAAFFQISPILQAGIVKKNNIEASSLDSVTNVYNRQYLTEHIEKIITLSGKEHKSIAFLMIGIDHFKAVIDEFDYEIGDKVLVELAKVIHSNIAEFDIVARLTSDEFLIALTHYKTKKDVQTIAAKIIKEFSETGILVNKETQQLLYKTICIGISYYPDDSTDINIALKNADRFLYEAKNKGRSQYAVYTKEQESSIDFF